MATSLARNMLFRAASRRSYQASPQMSRSACLTSPTSCAVNHILGFARWFASYPPHEVVGMPSLSPTMESGTISAWNVEEGAAYSAGDVLCSVETDKATVDFEAQDDGVVAKIIVAAGAGEIPCGTPIMVTVEDQGSVAAFKDFLPESSAAPPTNPTAAAPEPEMAAPTPTPIVSTPAAVVAAPASGERVIASPRAHTLAKEKGFGEISALRIVGTGPGGRIIAQDILEYDPSTAPAVAAQAAIPQPVTAAAPAPKAAPAPLPKPVVGSGYTDYSLPASAMELASRLNTSKKNVPHYYLTIDLNLDSLLELRSSLNSTIKDGGISVNDLLLKAAAAAMKTVPAANASWMDTFVRVYDSVDINVVVGNGSTLYAPVIRDVGRRGLKAVSDDFAAAAAVVEGNEDAPTAAGFGDVGTFTMVNLGMFGVKSCAPIIREPQACALALGAIENRIVPNDDTESEDIYKESVMMTATLSCDHRVVDGAVGAQWLSAFKNHVENPVTLLL
ncbi:hypothetical protein HJC23_003831 [Cyclotella cryptica]|uniref:Dihydrolipoamide acetyltransferase component of pyruvate dehydrogenase complex n=1 Tax=Cyclotella cryptica TaxID=29204 RepID=A0ABD3Q132_9STRA|eukprot:CCRYP_009984-RA/>CCRYP_009984-RA protein AED:0.05 eAED:0.05 QI:248/1/1/1/1/1/3/163/502